MGDPKKKKTPAEELIESLLKDVGGTASDADSESEQESASDFETRVDGGTSTELEGLVINEESEEPGFMISTEAGDYSNKVEETHFDSNENGADSSDNKDGLSLSLEDSSAKNNLFEAMGALQAQDNQNKNDDVESHEEPKSPSFLADTSALANELNSDSPAKDSETELLDLGNPNRVAEEPKKTEYVSAGGDSDKTVAVAGYQVRNDSDYDDKVKVSVGQNRGALSGYQAWHGGGSADSNLAQAENLRIAQDKILELESENEKLRLQNEELIAASEIIKERSDLLSSQLNEFKNDREGLEGSFKSEITLLKNHLAKKDAELQKAQIKIEELDSRLKFDMKKIRIRERELENRLELVRAEKNAVVKNKDEQILDLRRKMDVLQMEVESYRQKCVELNKSIESSQESFKRTTRALRLAMANLELQDENKTPLKKVD